MYPDYLGLFTQHLFICVYLYVLVFCLHFGSASFRVFLLGKVHLSAEASGYTFPNRLEQCLLC